MRFASLGSGSRGNAMVVEAGSTRLLLDCGFPLREIEARLARLGLTPADLSGIVVTHEHGDHCSGVPRIARRWQLPVWMTYGTLAALGSEKAEGIDCRLIDSHNAFAVAGLQVCPFPVPHDSREPVQFVFRDDRRSLAVLTDVGEVTAHVLDQLSGCDALVLECNHDRELLRRSHYPESLKRRIAGRFGHLANDVAADLLTKIDASRLQHLVAAHLSEHNNRAELAVEALAGALGCDRAWIGVATQAEGFSWRAIE